MAGKEGETPELEADLPKNCDVDMTGESDEEVVEEVETTQKQKPKKAPAKQKETTNCLACQKKCTGSQASVLCQLCSLWCHRECAGLSTAVFKSLALQVKEVGTAYWACKSCLSFAAKTNMLLKNMNSQITQMDSKITQNTTDITTNKRDIVKMGDGLKKVEKKVEDVKKQVEEEMLEEMQERESRRLNIVIHGIEEQDGPGENREKAERDKEACGRIFSAMEAGVRRDQIKFCRRIGERARDPRPLIVGLKSEEPRRKILENARRLPTTKYENVNIVADLTRKQRQEEVKKREEAERRNQNLSEEDRSKNLKWMVVGRKGEKRLIKAIEREYPERRDRNGDNLMGQNRYRDSENGDRNRDSTNGDRNRDSVIRDRNRDSEIRDRNRDLEIRDRNRDPVNRDRNRDTEIRDRNRDLEIRDRNRDPVNRDRNRETPETRDRFRDLPENQDRNRGYQRDRYEEGRETGARRRETGGWYGRDQTTRDRGSRYNQYGGSEEEERRHGGQRVDRDTENWRERDNRHITPPPPPPKETTTAKRARGTTPDSEQEADQPQAKATKQ